MPTPLSISMMKKNLDLLQDLLKKAKKNQVESASFDLYIEIATGRLFEMRKELHGEHPFPKITFYCNPEGCYIDMGASLEVEDRTALTHMIQIMNQLIRFTSLFFSSKRQYLENELFIASFYPDLDRVQAENILKKEPGGVYLFRCDFFAQILQDELTREQKQPISCCTLTITREEGGVEEYTLVFKEGALQIYSDAPCLDGCNFTTLEELLACLGATKAKTRQIL